MGDVRKVSDAQQKVFRSPDLTVDTLVAKADEFVAAVKDGSYADKGWPKSTYAVSKILVTAYTKVLARELKAKGSEQLVFAMCPGWCKTDMGGASAMRTAESGADTIGYLATAPADELSSGVFYADRKAMPDWL